MESPTLASMSIAAETSEFFRAELAAFVATNRQLRPKSWALVEQVQRNCLSESPATAEGLSQASQEIGR